MAFPFIKKLVSTLRKQRDDKGSLIDGEIAAARNLLSEGQAQQALDTLEAAIKEDPDNPQVLHLLGVSKAQTGNLVDARQLIERAIALKPSGEGFLTDLGNVLLLSGFPLEAERAFTEATQRLPDWAQGHFALGRFLQSTGKFAEAIGALNRALALNPDFLAPAISCLECQYHLQNYAEVAKQAEDILKVHPASVESLQYGGIAYIKLGKPVEAERLLQRLCVVTPQDVNALNNLGMALRLQNKLDQAETCCRKILAISPTDREANKNLLNLLLDSHRDSEALDVLNLTKRQFADDPDVWRFEAHLLDRNGDRESAAILFRRTIASKPSDHNALMALALILTYLGQMEEAEQLYRRAIDISPHALYHFNLAVHLLMTGKYRDGFREYEFRWETPNDNLCPDDIKSRFVPTLNKVGKIPRWQGETLEGKRILIVAEQGFGDNLMCLRFLSMLRKVGPAAELSFLGPKALERLVLATSTVDKFLIDKEWGEIPFSRFDFYSPMLSLPHYLGIELDTLPYPSDQLSIPGELIGEWQRRCETAQGLKVGLVWAGSEGMALNAARSMNLLQLNSLLNLRNVTFFSLQKGERQKELKTVAVQVYDFMDDCNDFFDTAAFITSLDLVISVDTSVAHLAGVLGKPVWLFNRYGSEWRWLRDRTDSPWYPSMTIFSQGKDESWEDVAVRMARALENWAPPKTGIQES